MKAAFLYSEDLTKNILHPDHVLKPARLQYVYELLAAYGVFEHPDALIVPPRPATAQELLRYHARDYVEAVDAFGRGEDLDRQHRYGFSEWGDNPLSPRTFEGASLASGASIEAAQAVLDQRVQAAFNAGGGYHHAAYDFASGFCVFNDPVLAIHHLLAKGIQRVAYVDIDAHHGDGVQNAFYRSNQVLTVSLHESGRFLFPGTGEPSEVGEGPGEGYSVNVPLAPQTDDEVYLWAFREIVPPLVRAFQPEVLVTQLGMDTHLNDPLTHLTLTSYGHTAAVSELKALSPGKWVAMGGGGYDISASVRCWAMDYAIMLGIDLPDEIPAAFADKYGMRRLRDQGGVDFGAGTKNLTWEIARETTGQVKQLIFPRFGLA